ncbi:MAG TPA: hypothetical protein VN151_01750, partial [Terracidiphilus sp.]|nr:hypothetical protein [Terracidiphilus sp.]
LAHNLFLHIDSKKGPVEVPIFPDSSKGGLVLAHPVPRLQEDDVTGTVRGQWGFDEWTGPSYHFHSVQQDVWRVAESDKSALVVGREDTLHLEGAHSLCVDKLYMQAEGGESVPITWKSPKPNQLEVTLPMQHAAPGPVTIEIRQFGLEKPDKLTVSAYAEAASLDRLTLAAGDATALLTGTRLDEVAKATLNGITWTPVALGRMQDVDQLSMNADRSTAALQPDRHEFATVLLRDGRELTAHVTVNLPRPQVVLLSKAAQEPQPDTAAAPNPVQIHYGSADDLPASRRLVFFFKSRVPANFPRDEKIEIAATDGSFHTLLSLADGGLMLSDATTAMVVVEPITRFGASAFGPIQARALAANSIAGDWIPLGTLVRVPGFHELRCPRQLARPCTLTATNLFLTAALAANTDFNDPVDVRPDFTGTQLTVPHPANGELYLKLRDDPATVQTVTLPVLPMSVVGPAVKPGPARSAAQEPPPAAAPEAAAPQTANAAPQSTTPQD